MTAATPTTAEITESLTELVAGHLGLAPDDLSPDTDLRTVHGADSVKVLRIIAGIEQEYDVQLEDAEVFAVTTVSEIATVVASALEATP